MKNKFINTKKWVLTVLCATVLIGALFSTCGGESADGTKSNDSSLSQLEIGGITASLGTGNADWDMVVPGSVNLTETTNQLSITATPNNDGAAVTFAKITSQNATQPEFSVGTSITTPYT